MPCAQGWFAAGGEGSGTCVTSVDVVDENGGNKRRGHS